MIGKKVSVYVGDAAERWSLSDADTPEPNYKIGSVGGASALSESRR